MFSSFFPGGCAYMSIPLVSTLSGVETEAPAALPVAAEEPRAQRSEPGLLHRAHHGREQIGDDEAPDEGAEDAQHFVDRLAERGQLGQQHVKQDGRRDHAEGRDPPVEIFLVPAESPSHGFIPPLSLSLFYIILLSARLSVNTQK